MIDMGCWPEDVNTLMHILWLLSRKKIIIHLPFPFLQTMSLQELQKDFGSASPTDTNNNQTAANGPRLSYVAFNPSENSAGQVNPSYEQSRTTSHRSSTCSTIPTTNVDPILTAPPFVNFHTIILDISGVCFVDLMGTKALGKVS